MAYFRVAAVYAFQAHIHVSLTNWCILMKSDILVYINVSLRYVLISQNSNEILLICWLVITLEMLILWNQVKHWAFCYEYDDISFP